MLLDYLESELAALEVRVNQDIVNHFGEINYGKLMDASGNYDNDYLNTDAKVNCANAVAGLIAARTALNERNIESTIYAMKHVTHFWTSIYIFDQQKIKASGKARANADKRHTENKLIKAEALAYYAKHKDSFGNKGAAASYISNKIVPVAFRTVRQWLSKVP